MKIPTSENIMIISRMSALGMLVLVALPDSGEALAQAATDLHARSVTTENINVSTGSLACDFSLWTGIAPNSGNEPILGCYGVGISHGAMPILYPAITGVDADFVGDNRKNGYANLLVQWRSRYGSNNTEAGLAVNGLSDTGMPGPDGSLNHASKVDILATHSKRGDSGPAWNVNGNMILRQGGGGKTPAYNVEWDMANFDRPYPGVSFQEFFTFQSVYPVHASIAFDAVTLEGKYREDTFSMTAGNPTLTLVSGDINEWYATQPVEAAQIPDLIPKWTNVAAVSSNTITLSQPPTQSGTFKIQGRATGAKYGILFNSRRLYNDTTIFDGSDTPTSIRIDGLHKIGISIGPDVENPFLGNGKPVCLNAYSACLRSENGIFIEALSPIQANGGIRMAFGSGVQYSASTVAGLPTCNSTTLALVSAVYDANAPVVGAIVTGGGGSFALTVCDGGSHRVYFKAS